MYRKLIYRSKSMVIKETNLKDNKNIITRIRFDYRRSYWFDRLDGKIGDNKKFIKVGG